MSPLWLYLHFPSIQLDTLYSSEAQRHQPIAILNTHKNQVCQRNRIAKERGITLGMGLANAAMLEPDLSVIPYQVKAEENKLQEIADTLYQVTSDIHLFKPNGLLLRIHNMLNLYGGLSAYWAALRLQLNATGIRYNYATGYAPLCARLLARRRHNVISDEKQHIQNLLHQSPIEATDLPPRNIAQLKRVGIHKVGELLQQPRKSLTKRFDIKFINYLGRLNGELQHPIEFYQPKEHFHRYLTLLFDVEHKEQLISPLRKLLDDLEHFLRFRELLTEQLIFTLHQRDEPAQCFKVGSVSGDDKASSWLPLIELKLEKIQLSAPVFAIEVEAGNTQPKSAEINDLFSANVIGISYAQLISLLSARLGESALLHPQIVNDHRPEYASQYREALQPTLEPLSLQLAQEKARLRPSFLLKTPLPLQEKTQLIYGPERISTGWWDDNAITRDYFIARTPQGRFYWVYRTPSLSWFVHGIFS
ncbi:Y-family DNA polymerase [Alteromonas sp. a30]|uniref:Y-family DNA polymerase n=1 Tax=Alteromonas sp. a30 TaxID=2730917 RepID=UPI0022816A16|nr:DNA polymerase Y family protein [Alteromonas sp. a30]MCY7295783.1 DNA polymerase Y family protein [Alteromonas sp. a30]